MRRNEALEHLIQPFVPFLANPATTEIVVNRPGEFGVEASGQWSWHTEESLTFDRLDAIGVLTAYRSSREFNPSNPEVATTLPGGERLQACRAPATVPETISLTIRKPTRRKVSLDDDDVGPLLDGTNAGPAGRTKADADLLKLYHAQDWRGFYRLAMRAKKTIGVCGKVATGKTTFLRRLLAEIPETDRVVTVEDTAEFGDAGPGNLVNLFYGDGRANLTAEQIIKASLRMRMDWLIMQEVRGPEAFGFIRALASGHSGATSWHAEEGEEFDALELMIRQHEAGRAIPDVRRYLQTYIDVVVYCAKDASSYHTPRVWFKAVDEAAA
jgi:type IV secretion system protein VirB11